MHAVLAGRLPEGQVLSHDLLEGSLARCAAVTDITVIEDAPFHADVAASRVHRWTRGDWQLLPFLFAPGRYRLRAINRWKMFDNLRRSLVAPMSLALLLLALAGAGVSPWAALALVLAAFTAGPLMGAVAGFAPSRDDIAKLPLLPPGRGRPGARAVGRAVALAQLLQQALMAVDAIVRALYRMTVSRRHLLQWTTAASAQAQAQTALAARCCASTGACRWWRCCCSARCSPRARRTRRSALALCLLWAASPVWHLVGQPAAPGAQGRGPAAAGPGLPGRHRARHLALLRALRRAEDNHLPPDNLQTTPLRHGGAPHLADQHRPVPAERGLRAGVRLDRHAGPAGAPRGHAGHAGHAAAPPRPLPELVRHADAARRCCRCTCPPSTAAT